MNEFYERISQLSPKRLALLALELQSKLEAAERSRREPIAIVGMACRFPGAASPEAFWELLRDGVDAVGEIPASRWDSDAYYDPDPDAPGKVATRWGGFVEPIDGFEPQLFGISPREAQTMDPQQRLLLEVSWEALENAGIGPARLNGSPTGVFVGICNNDYVTMLLGGDAEQIDAYLSTGNAHSVASGRLSYVLGLQGPSLAVDTACSSSLVAIHLAVQSLRNGECRAALAGGVNAILSPTTTITLSRARMMAADGRCKAFDASADGFVRSEGCGMLVLKRLSDAQADGNNILAVIRGSAINQDGRSNGLTAPNGPSQVAVIRAALEDAGLAPADVHYVETHGTGTSLGDPIEVQALGAALGSGRDASSRLQIGSVKTNLGHLESAAGVAGLIKAVLMLGHGQIPPHLHLTQLNPHIAWDELPIDVPTAGVPWPERPGSRIAGVSSFGFSGTNAHVLLEAAPAAAPAQPAGREQQLLTLAARTPAALHALAQRFTAHLEAHAELPAADVAFTANLGRAQLPHRLAVAGATLEQLREGLQAFVAGEEHDSLLAGHAEGPRPPQVAFVFTGHGSQYVAMGRKLYQSEPAFRAALDRCDQLLRAELGRPLLEILDGPSANGTAHPLDTMRYAQPALFALQYALAELWQSWGIRPAAVLGHSVGEYAAAVVAGVMSLEDGVKLVAARGRLMQSLPPDGEMAAVMADEAFVEQLIAPYDGKVTIAAINGPSSVVISGPAALIDTLMNQLAATAIEARRLAIPVAAHSTQVDPILDDLGAVASQISFSAPQLDVVSGMTGRLATPDELANPAYWRRHLRRPVRFADAAQTLYDLGYRAYVEIGPHPTLLNMMRRFLPADGAAWAPSLRRQQDDARQILAGLGALHVAGVAVDWDAFYGGERRRHVPLPTYPFERRRYWAEVAPRTAAGHRSSKHPLLGAPVSSPAVQGRVFERYLSAAELPFLADHRVFDALVLPSPAFLEMALAAARAAGAAGPLVVERFMIREALVLPEQGGRVVQVVLSPAPEGATPFQIWSRAEGDDTWTLHVDGSVVAGAGGPEAMFDPEEVQASCSEQIAGAEYYRRLERAGLAFGERFRGLEAIWRRDGEALGLVELPESLAPEAGRYGIHPALLDAALHLLGAPLPNSDSATAFLLLAIDRVQLYATPGARLWSHVTLRAGGDAAASSLVGDVRLYDEHGAPVAELSGILLKAADRAALMRATRSSLGDWQYEVVWQPRPLAGADTQLAAPALVAARVEPLYTPLAEQHELDRGLEQQAELEALSASYAVRALSRLGWAPLPGEVVSAEALAARLGVVARHRRLFGRLLAMLAEEGQLRPHRDGWQVLWPLHDQGEQRRMIEASRARASGSIPELDLLERCGEQLAEVLRGEADPVELLFPGGSLALTEPLYRETPFARIANTMVAETVRAALAERPAGRQLRVLEIGAGSGATTRAVLPVLTAGSVEYWFTDVSPHFTSRAQAELAAYQFVRTHVFDVERAPSEQGLPLHSFDLVLAANVLHATADLGRTLRHAGELLAPGGELVLLEGTRALRWVDLTFGLTDGWWRFSDLELRHEHPLLGASEWIDLLMREGFRDATAVTPEHSGQAVLVARAPRSVAAPGGDEWLIFADAGGVGAALAGELERAGESVALVHAGPSLARRDARSWQVNADAEAIGQLLAELGRPERRRRIVFLWALDTPDATSSAESLLRAQERGAGGALALAQALAGQPAELWLVTRGAQPAGPIVAPAAVGQAALWGLGRVIALEQPELWGGLIDLDLDPADDASALLAELRRPDGEDQVALRGAERLVPRLERAAPLAAATPRFRADGSYLITGGLGALGLKLAGWLAEHGAGHLVLTGRHGLPERAAWPTLKPESRQAQQAAAIEALEALGASVTVAAVDVADAAAMAALFRRFGAELPPLRGVFHAAAALGQSPLRELTTAQLLEMLRPKLAGGWLLHELSLAHELDAFVLYSSTTALWGSRDLAHYAAANQTLDALAHYRHSLGLTALSINWGTWDEMRVASEAEQQMVAGYGLGRMPSEQALAALGALLDTGATQMAIAAVDWDVLKPAYEARRARPLLADMAVTQRVREPEPGRAAEQAVPELLRRVDGVTGEERRALIADYVREAVARALGIGQARQIDDRQGLFELGMDSLMSVELKGRLERSVGQSLPATLTFNYPSVAELAGFFADELLAEPAAEPVAEAVPVHETAAPDDHDDLSEDDLAALLAAKLARLS